jgi:Lar family restriction alleviation protein
MSKLKPCPFCGGTVEINTITNLGNQYYGVYCLDCLVAGIFFSTKEEAIARWNQRVPAKEMNEQLKNWTVQEVDDAKTLLRAFGEGTIHRLSDNRLILMRPLKNQTILNTEMFPSVKRLDDIDLKEIADYNPEKSQIPCDCYHLENGRLVCWGTKEKEGCRCGGDRRKCDFYPEVRRKAMGM